MPSEFSLRVAAICVVPDAGGDYSGQVLHLPLEGENSEKPVLQPLKRGVCRLAFQRHVIGNPKDITVAGSLQMPCIPTVEVDFQQLAQLPVEFSAGDHQSDFRVQPQRPGIQVCAADERVLMVYGHQFRMEPQFLLINGLLHVAGTVLGLGTDFVHIRTMMNQPMEMVPIGAVGGDVVVRSQGIGEDADFNAALFRLFHRHFKVGSWNQICRNQQAGWHLRRQPQRPAQAISASG